MVTSLEALDICSERCQLSAASRKRLSPLRLTQSTSNLSALLERARLSFATGGATAGSQNSSHVTSDSGVTSSQAADLGDTVTSPTVMSPMLQSYIETLSEHGSTLPGSANLVVKRTPGCMTCVCTYIHVCQQHLQ